MNFNYIDSSRNNLIEKSEYEFYLEEIGITQSDEVMSKLNLIETQSPVGISQNIDSQQGVVKALAHVTGGLILLYAGRRLYKKMNKKA